MFVPFFVVVAWRCLVGLKKGIAEMTIAAYYLHIDSDTWKWSKMARGRPKSKFLSLNELISAAEVTRIYGLGEGTVKEAIKRGTVDGIKIGRDYVMLKKEAAQRWDIPIVGENDEKRPCWRGY